MTAEAAPITLPSPEEMQQSMRQSGVLDKQTIMPGQNQANFPNDVSTQQVQLASAAKDGNQLKNEFDSSWLRRYIPKLVAIALTVQGLYGIYQSVLFIFVDFPALETLLEQHLITSAQVNSFASKAIVTVISTIISMFFAMRLTFLKSKAARVFNTVIGVAIFFGNTFITSYFSSLDTGVIFSTTSVSMIEFGVSQLRRLRSMIQL
jgi:hypothetical protein